ncbi:ABC-F family ATP-binding cassette domain-containing protein [Treponema zuelzerae]|uniref:ABC-F family ATP-binding cassette domain-containing protein n=1 Tax=Teretinema zuelzerae TaxID=156 RepID=A0AAE3EJV6_9SPIR|nr:ABC-F family ATP-binding cassette domain-containing protein [Teretinema zuelzerae]MCD1655852.1 ABC-F family ATP-binding cassette domain-containing protein [Teretinema zuelzerae]
MNLLSVSKLTRMGREAPLFVDVTFGLDEGEKAALIGRNGSGKSTLLRCIAGVIPPDSGSIVVNKEAGVSFLPQNPEFEPGDTIRAHIYKSDSPKLKIIREYEDACELLSRAGQTSPSERVRRELERLTHEMDSKDLWNYENSIRSILTTLGITNLELKMGTLSGGMAKKVSLAQVLIEDTKVLLLDEPTNHLDITTIAWLEEHLRTTPRSVLMVTHDRYFLDSICTSIREIDRKTVTLYEGNFSKYLEKKAIAEEIAANTDARIESVLRTEREWLLRGPQARGTKAKARIDSIHRMINREKFAQDKGFAFEVTGRRLGGKILEVEGISKAWPVPGGTKTVIRDFSYQFKKGERIGVFGDNGSGKTTLLNILMGEVEADGGRRSAGDNTVFGYYRQNPEFPDLNMTVLEYIKEKAEVITRSDGTELTASKMLEQFGFEGRVQYSPLLSLSGGERKRVYLVRLLMSNPNFLVLDEPTNDFDIYTMSVLESFLEGFGGCLLVVSHDRYFMDRVVDTLFILEDDGSISGFVGTCSEYLVVRENERQSAAEEAKEAAAKNASKAGTEEAAKNAAQPKKKKRSFREAQEYAEIENVIEKLEERKTELENKLSSGSSDHRLLAEISEQLTATGTELEEKILRWEYLSSLE